MLYEEHTCPSCGENVDILLDGRELKSYEWCQPCKDNHYYEDWVIRWFNHRTGMFTRRDIIVRDGAICYICGTKIGVDSRDLTIDHVIPLARGGHSTLENMKVCCNDCNNKKGDLLLEEMNNFLDE